MSEDGGRCRDALIAASKADWPANIVDDLEVRLSAALNEGRQAWPDASVDPETFGRYLASRIPTDISPSQALDKLHVADLYLACACAAADENAIASFRHAFAPHIAAVVRKTGPDHLVDEVVQGLMLKLFVGSERRDPQIERYTGTGSLRAWVRVLAARDTHGELRKRPREKLSDLDELADRVLEVEDEELERLKHMYREQFKQAFAKAFAGLDTRERNLLRHEYLDGLNIDHIGVLYGVHRATVARWRTRARTSLFEQTRRVLTEELSVNSVELDSILRLIQSQLDVSLPRLLVEDADDESG